MRHRFYGLKKIKVRQSWNKYNLYNLSRIKSPISQQQTFFQQKWAAKSLSRGYHGETIREKHWQRMFRPTLRSVVPMNHEYLARTDGSEQALGRGSGLEMRPDPDRKLRGLARTPYMNMVYAPTERRLDTAIFRALFASSTRQARQFVVHGYVKVNGKKMIYPGYQLNPGDMFQVEPERVLFATGAPKDRNERRAGRKLRALAKSSSADIPEKEPEIQAVPEDAEEQVPQDPKGVLTSLLTQAKSILNTTDDLSGKKKRALRAFSKEVKRTLSRKTTDTTITDSLDAQLLELTSRLNISETSTKPTTPTTPTATTATTETNGSPDAKPRIDGSTIVLPSDERRMLREALAEARENPIDPSKAYATPWRPREYMSAFAFVPRYLEVHHKICSAVYLRHPVARPGLGEVPTPFPAEVNGLAFNWYLRRR
ncbi:mitochondrial 37S ribosomal protein nam9 [Xylographa bjoerkii]|nr:mitochondrial 37S ribosomal protein nam9 [Xylographa bjoerkii]